MNYVKKMCILRQAKQGFSGDGKTLSGLVKAEQYGKNLAVEVSIINFAPLVSGEYYCLLSDEKGRTEILALRGKSLFNILTDMEIADGFCAVVCFVKNEIVPIAYGVNGNGNYDWKRILSSALSPALSKKEKREEAPAPTPTPTPPPVAEEPAPAEASAAYDDETVATENYYREEENGQNGVSETREDARAESAGEEQDAEAGTDPAENGDADDVLHAFKTESDGYYLSVKSEIDELMKNYPRDDTLKGAFSCSEWVRVKGEEGDPQYLVGVVYEDGTARYVCYALATENKDDPPEEIGRVSTFVPASPFDERKGFFVIFQSAATGECVKPVRM
ncbi:MAG: hypothetical protein IJX91_03850 [Clostridia bacterium]|nr:hypothetical protein [Clostridia bacterium]